MSVTTDVSEIVLRIVKYLITGIVIGLATFLVCGERVKLHEILVIGVTAAAVFAILDMYAPEVGAATRLGAGLGLGAQIVRF